MEFDEAIRLLNRGNCILFTGSGFSIGAKNMRKNTDGEYLGFRLSTDITLDLAKLAGIENEPNLTFGDVSQYCKETVAIGDLIDFLKKEFTFSSITKAQECLGSIKWRRIYTTNYDEIIEEAQRRARIQREPVSINISTKDVDIRKVCVHLNGVINNLNEKTLDGEFKLTKKSYDNDDLLYSPWLDLFKKDLLSADAVFFVGFSGSYDLDLTRIFEQTKELRGKTFFVVYEKTGILEERNLSRFGKVLKIGTAGFAEQLKNVKPIKPLDEDETLQDIRCFRSPECGDFSISVRSDDFLSLISKGDVNNPLFANSVREPNIYPYFIYRDKIDDVIKNIKEGNNRFLILSDLGNGKSLFLKGLAVRLKHEGFNPYLFEKDREFIFDEVQKICRYAKNPIIIVDNYNDHINVVNKFQEYLSDKASLIIADRSARYETTFYKLGEFNDDAIRIDLDILSTKEIKQIIEVFDRYGLWDNISTYNQDRKIDFIKNRCKSRLSTFLISRFSTTQIKESYHSVIDAIAKKREYYQALLFIMCSNYFGFNIEYGLIIESIGGNVLNNVAFRNNPDVKEFINFDKEEIQFSSSLLSKYILSRCIDGKDLEDYLIKLFKSLDLKASYDKNLKRVLRSLV